MKTLKYLLYIVLGLAALTGILGLLAKSQYHIERSIEIDAPKELVYEQIRRFKNFHDWSPWTKLDTSMSVTYSGTDGEPGASYAWSGNNNVGEGKITLLKVAPERLDLQLDVIKPFKIMMPAYFLISGDEVKTKVTWAFDPKLPFPYNVGAMFTDIDKAMGADYAYGLGYLKRRCEGMAHKKYRGYEIAEEDLPISIYAALRGEVPMEEVEKYYAENMLKIQEMVRAESLSVVGPPTGLFWSYDETKGVSDMAAALPIKEDQKLPKTFKALKIGNARALIIEYMGEYSQLKEAHLAMDEYMTGNGLQHIPPVMESYVTDTATETDTSKWLTKVIYFVEPIPDSTALRIK